MITVALSKGRLLKSFLAFLEAQGLDAYRQALENPDRALYVQVGPVRFLFAKASDVPTYVENAVADLGITGLDRISEKRYDVLNVLELPFGRCRLSLAGPPGVEEFRRIATSYDHLASQYFLNQRQEVQIIHLSGSVELAPILGLADGIVDIVDSGATLKMNGLIEYETIMTSTVCLVANKRTYYTKEDEIYEFMNQLGVIG
ncbi:ATP phosphoribosyltransferase [Actinobaculum suis]|uniref:ATP phosphoribosyltransferase n=1 Tax=Actinobaculum suis TaxID=1657 RepID=A0A1B9BCA5_9ACTO|nr:ATP phosphoribosyltransferase [Actinobaculum suis]MDY5153840.1 ATP phosphoribosyltransferase [Actinobaculum suis]OCA93274.1 ATP phosphoribosyltransferase [Actinobaculum suis]OCA94428.1 ATP phosphoribosyltransferase [Actinobaculum suis]SDD98686.1 ATP phosphoribosyltransferase [Actinobaculum suis]VDG76698.1 ATP phosphoribosyltransferase catalytic subunit [Actinobaculum suis]